MSSSLSSPLLGNQEGANSDTSITDNGVQQQKPGNQERANSDTSNVVQQKPIKKLRLSSPHGVTPKDEMGRVLKLKNAELLEENTQLEQEMLKDKTENVMMRQGFVNLTNSSSRKNEVKEAGSIQADKEDINEGKGNEAGSIQANSGCSSHMPKLKPLLITREELGECRLNTEDPEVPDNDWPWP